MKDKNAVLIGFVSSAIDYLKSQDNRDIAELLEENELDDIKGDLTAKLNSLLYNANADSDYLVNAGKEAFSDFVVDKKKTLVDEFAELFDGNANKEKDIVDRLEELLTNSNEDPDLSELFPGLLLDAPEDGDDDTKKLFNNVLKEVESASCDTDELDEVFSEILAHENGVGESLDIEDLFEDDTIVDDDLINDLVSDETNAIDEMMFILEEPDTTVHMSPFTVPAVKKNEKSDSVVYEQICECSDNIASVVDSEREYYGVSAPVMWVAPVREIHMSSFTVPAVKKNEKSDSVVYEQICECSDNIAAVVDSEREYYGVSAPVMWIAPEKTVHMSAFVVPTVKKNDKTDSAIYAQICECSDNIASVVDSEREYYGVPAPVMWVAPVREIHMSPFTVPAVKKNEKSDSVVYEQICECSDNIAAVVDSEREYYGVSAPVMWVAPAKEIHMSEFTVPAVKKNDKTDSQIYDQICECSDIIASVVDLERELNGVAEPVAWEEPDTTVHMSSFTVPAVKKNEKSDSVVYEQICECSDNIASVVDSEREYYGVPAPVMWEEPVKEVPNYTWIANPGLDYLDLDDEEVSGSNDADNSEKEVQEEEIEQESENSMEDDFQTIDDYLDDFLNETKDQKADLNDYLNDLVDELESTIKIPKIDQVYISIAELYPYLSQDFIHVVYDLKNVVASEYPFGKKMILLHRLNFKEIEGLRSFVEIALDHGYQVNADENQMIVDAFKEYVNSDGLILTAIFEIANQAAVFAGEYEGYRVIPVDQEV